MMKYFGVMKQFLWKPIAVNIISTLFMFAIYYPLIQPSVGNISRSVLGITPARFYTFVLVILTGILPILLGISLRTVSRMKVYRRKRRLALFISWSVIVLNVVLLLGVTIFRLEAMHHQAIMSIEHFEKERQFLSLVQWENYERVNPYLNQIQGNAAFQSFWHFHGIDAFYGRFNGFVYQLLMLKLPFLMVGLMSIYSYLFIRGDGAFQRLLEKVTSYQPATEEILYGFQKGRLRKEGNYHE